MLNIITSFIRYFLIFFNCIAIGIFLFLLSIVIYFNSPRKSTEDQKFIINNNDSFREVVNNLHEAGIIDSKDVFFYVSQIIKGKSPKVKYGEYLFRKNDSYDQIMEKIQSGDVFFRRLTIIEGMSAHSAMQAINEALGLKGKGVNVEEGVLLPETYFYSYGDSRQAIVHEMTRSMDNIVDTLWQNRDKSIPIRSKKEAVILASIVEKESGKNAERSIIASVFMNRLKKGMKLQSDPTIIYSYAFGNKALERPIKRRDIRNKSPYNTYNIYGLPPKPICNPGITSIKAVLNPAKTNYLYFVASGYGHHNFSPNLKQHNAYVRQYYKILKERRRKSEIN